jgi:hypothetical protein
MNLDSLCSRTVSRFRSSYSPKQSVFLHLQFTILPPSKRPRSPKHTKQNNEITILAHINTKTHTRALTYNTATVFSFQALEKQNTREGCSYSSILTGWKSRHKVPLRSQDESALYVLMLGNFEVWRKYELLRRSLLTTAFVSAPFGIKGITLLPLLNEIKTIEAKLVVMN